MKSKLTDIAYVIRSKNSGPFELTLDIIFKSQSVFERVCKARAINKELISRLYGIPQEKISGIVEYAPANAVKITFDRPMPSGAPGETDVYGAQQHAPLLDLELDI